MSEVKPRKLAKYPKPPDATRSRLTHTRSGLLLDLPGARSWTNARPGVFALGTAVVLVALLPVSPQPFVVLVLFALALSFQVFKSIWYCFGTTRFFIGATSFEVKRRLFGMSYTRRGETWLIDRAEIDRRTEGRTRVEFVALHAGTVVHRFGRHLSEREREWVVDVIHAFIRNSGRTLPP